jgi:hypothetical protein
MLGSPVGARGFHGWRKLLRIPEIDVKSLDLFNEHQDRAARRCDLLASVTC